MKETLYQLLQKNNIEGISGWRSDLYAPVNWQTTELINSWFKESGLKKDLFVSTFKSQINGERCYEIKFAYDPYWETRAK